MYNFTEVLNGCCEDNRVQQKVFFEYFAPRMLPICNRYASDDEGGQDILQDAFIKMYSMIKGFKGEDPAQLYAWVKRVVTNTAIDYYRMEKRNHFHVNIDEVHISDESSGVELSYLDIKNVDVSEIVSAVQNLSPKYRMVFNLYVMEGLSHDEIAKEMGISVGTSKSNLFKAKANIKKELTKAVV